MVGKTAKVWSESKIVPDVLCFTIETGVGGGGAKVGGWRRADAGYVRASLRAGLARRPHWQESSKVAERKATHGILLGNASADC